MVSVTVVSIFVHTPLKVVWFVVCICYTSNPIYFLHCLAVDIPNQQLYAKPKGGMGPTTEEARDPKQAPKKRLGRLVTRLLVVRLHCFELK